MTRSDKPRLTWRPRHDDKFRWLPRHGEPLCVAEWASQRFVKITPALTLVIVAVSLAIQILRVGGWL